MWHHLRILFQNRELIWAWAQRGVVAQYRQSLLGVGWAVLPPFVQMVLFSIIFGGLLQIDTGDVPYPVFSYVALVPWSFFAKGVTAATSSIMRANAMVTKIYFPRETLLIAAVLSNGVDLVVSLVIVFGMILVFGMPLHLTLIALPLIFLIQFLFMLGIGFFTATITVFFRDISFAMNFILQAWMYLTPIIYPLEMVPELLRPVVIALNPMANLIAAYRRVIIDGTWPEPLPLVLTTAIALLLCVLGYGYLKRREALFADIM